MCHSYWTNSHTASLPQGRLHNALHSSRWQSSRCFTDLVDRTTIISTMFEPEVWGSTNIRGIKQVRPKQHSFIHQFPHSCSRFALWTQAKDFPGRCCVSTYCVNHYMLTDLAASSNSLDPRGLLAELALCASGFSLNLDKRVVKDNCAGRECYGSFG